MTHSVAYLDDHRNVEMVVESDSLAAIKGAAKGFTIWRVTGRNQEKVDDETTHLGRSPDVEEALFTFPRRITDRSDRHFGWFSSIGFTRDSRG